MAALKQRSGSSPGVASLVMLVVLSGLVTVACGGEGSEARSANALQPVSSAGTTAQSADPAVSSASNIDANGELLLDELDDDDALFAAGAVSGEWFTYSDGTSPITPPDHTRIAAVGGEAHVFGSGFSDWGAGLSAYFRSVDLTAFDGFRLRAHGSGSIVVELATPASSPAAEGGTCVGNGCFGHFATSLELGPESRDYDIPFATLAQPTWAQPAQLALEGVISLNLVVKGSAASPASIDLWVERLALHAVP
jgi:hypothetical protein